MPDGAGGVRLSSQALPTAEMGTGQQENPVDKVYIVMVSEFYVLESGESFFKDSVSAVFSSHDSAKEYIDDLGLTGPDRYFIKEVSVKN
jgi:hypothetical protein